MKNNAAIILAFKTIENINLAEYKQKGSRFIALAYPVQELNEVKVIQDNLKKEHIKAVHVCYAYRMGIKGEIYKTNDDGEPSGTAGQPILGQIDSLGLTNVVVMVVRYFGGTLLGTSGLIKAYKTVTREALATAKIIEKKIYKKVKIQCSYSNMNEIMIMINKTHSEIIKQDLEFDCKLVVNIPLAEYNNFLNYFSKRLGVKIGEDI